jgi:hypothetical protein
MEERITGQKQMAREIRIKGLSLYKNLGVWKFLAVAAEPAEPANLTQFAQAVFGSQHVT